MTGYLDSLLQWVDMSGPMVRIPFLILLILLYYLIFRLIRNLAARISTRVTAERQLTLKVQNQEIVSDNDMSNIVVRLIRGVGLLIAIFIGFLFLNIALGLFEWGRNLALNLLSLTKESIGLVFQKIIDYIPDLLVIVVVLLIVRFVLHVLRIIFKGIDRGRINIPGFYAEWSATSFNLLRVLIYALTFVIIFPYLPGSD